MECADCVENWGDTGTLSSNRKVRLYAGCPIKGCVNSNKAIYWKCPCDHELFIHDNGFLSCCYIEGSIINWKFKCGAHDYEYASFQGFLNMLSVLGHLTADEDFFDECLEAVRKMRKQFKGN